MLEGLRKDKVLNISSESCAVVTAFMECMRFSLLRTPSTSGQDSEGEVQEYLVKEQVRGANRLAVDK